MNSISTANPPGNPPPVLPASRRARRGRRAARPAGIRPEEVRRHIAGELHDCALQLLVKAHSDLGRPDGNQMAIARTRETLDAAIAEIRRILDGVPEAAVDERGGLEAALRALCDRAAERTGVVARCAVDPGTAGGPYDDLLYMLAREFIENTVKHAGASSLEVTVRQRSRVIELAVTDDGAGMGARGGAGGHLGLRLAEHRVQGAGGRLAIDVGPRGGTRMVVLLPEGGGTSLSAR